MSRRGLARYVERADFWMHGRLGWGPRWLCDLAEVTLGVPVSEEPHGVNSTCLNRAWERWLNARPRL